jgi:hypothetical protein
MMVRDIQFQGVASCAAMACHHGNGPAGSKGSEYTTWVTNDRHARAYAALFDDRAQRIARNLGIKRPAEDKLCLHCHVCPNVGDLRRADHFSLEDGVGCEACHGPAEKWKGRHFLPGWQGKRDRNNSGDAPRDTKDLLVRARVCVPCHVGTGAADVNHDLIAAGHPRLKFEYGASLANLPKHWSDQEDRAGRPDFQARVWAIGQAVSAQAALELLQARAEAAAQARGAETRPWPEFAEYDCYACHHDLAHPSWRQQREYYQGRTPGTLPWGTWYFPMARALARQAPGVDLESPAAPLQTLRKQMSLPVPDPTQVAREARRAADGFEGWLRQLANEQYQPERLRALLTAFVSPDPAELNASCWDHAAQRYLAVAALYHALGDFDPQNQEPQIRATLGEMIRQLRFPKNYDSPRDYRKQPGDR